MQVSLELAVAPKAAAIAREVVAGALVEAPVSEAQIEDVRLLTSEVVTNAVRHARVSAGDCIAVEVKVGERQVRVEVADGGRGFDPSALPEPSPEGVGGWGLHLVKKLSDRWGVINNDTNLVWFEINLDEPFQLVGVGEQALELPKREEEP